MRRGGEEGGGLSSEEEGEGQEGGLDKWEREERMRRRTSVIVHGLEESEAVDASEKREADRVRLTDVWRVGMW